MGSVSIIPLADDVLVSFASGLILRCFYGQLGKGEYPYVMRLMNPAFLEIADLIGCNIEQEEGSP